MDKQAFKQRMRNLKSYRENNPGKGYWDFKDDRTDHPVEKPKMSIEPIKRVYTINQGKPDDSWKKWDKDGDGDLSPEEHWERQKSERRAEDWKKLGSGINKTFGTAAALASIVAGGGWATTRLLNGNKASTLGLSLIHI